MECGLPGRTVGARRGMVVAFLFYLYYLECRKTNNMQKPRLYPFILLCCSILIFINSHAQDTSPDTVKTGVYITSIHNIDFKDKEFAINFWVWFKYKRKEFDFYNNLELPSAKSVNKSYVTIDTSDGKVYMLMKLECVMKDSWKITNFPFDQQKLRISIENSQYDSRSLIFEPDTVGNHYDPRFALSGWRIDSCLITSGIKAYETAFGDESFEKPHTEYSTFRTRLSIHRDAMGLFWKLFLGMYIACMISFVCFFIHSDGIDSRFGLSVGALFAVIGNKYIIDSSLPESASFTLVDSLHGLTLCFILCTITATAWSLKLIKTGQALKAATLDRVMAAVLLSLYIILNIYFISAASAG